MKLLLFTKGKRTWNLVFLTINETNKLCGRARSHILAGAMPAPEGWPATG